MSEKPKSSFLFFRSLLRWWKSVRDKFAAALDVDEDRKTAIYIDLSNSTTLKDILYWLQIFFSAGIAMLGLVLNSSAVIIGAMLISPLMGPILGAGLALATGDLILAVRSLVNLILSSFGAILFAVILVSLLPFTVTDAGPEIKNRITPNTLDLGIALFSGAVGSVAICREVRGVVTSIPGVAIAVALMPPLCVVGFGLGLIFNDGLGFAIGGGLLYLTNLVAIIFTAMLVFILLRIDTPKVRARVREWRQTDPESIWWQNAISKIPSLEHAREIRSMSLRLLMVLLPLLLIFIPLSQSYNTMYAEILEKREQNKVQNLVRETSENFLKENNRNEENFDLTINKTNNPEKLKVYLRIIDNNPFTQEERDSYLTKIGQALNRRDESLLVNLAALPTSAQIASKPQAEETPLPPSIAELQGQFLQSVKSAMTGLNFPSSASLLDYKIINSVESNASIELYYLSEREIDSDARELLSGEIRRRLSLPNIETTFERVPIEVKKISFQNNGEKMNDDDTDSLDIVGSKLKISPKLNLEVALNQDNSEVLLKEKEKTIKNYMSQNWSISSERIAFVKSKDEDQADSYRIVLAESPAPK